MPKSSRRKGGKKKAKQYGKQIKDRRIGSKIKQERLFEELRQKYHEDYENQIKAELERREKLKETAMNEVELDSTKEYVPDFLGKSENLFEDVKTTKK